MNRQIMILILVMGMTLIGIAGLSTQQVSAAGILIHMKTSLAEDDAQICAVPNMAWAAVKAGHNVTILVDASAVTSVTKGFGWFRGLIGSDTTRWSVPGFLNGNVRASRNRWVCR